MLMWWACCSGSHTACRAEPCWDQMGGVAVRHSPIKAWAVINPEMVQQWICTWAVLD